MNLQPSEAELRLQMQQIEAQSLNKRSLNPFAAAFGLGMAALLIWFAYISVSGIARLASVVREWL